VDLNTITEFVPAPGVAWQPGDAWLGGGTWLFSEPQPGLRRLLDLRDFGWPALTESEPGLEIAATCTIAELAAWQPAEPWSAAWRGAATLAGQCAQALLASFKVQNVATVGGNLCLSLPAGAMISLTAALDAAVRLCAPDGTVRRLPAREFVTGPGGNQLRPGELLRSVFIPAGSLRGQTAFRQASLAPVGRSAALVIGWRAAAGDGTAATVTVTAATPRPVRLRFADLPTPAEAVAALDRAVPGWYDDVHGRPAWRAAMTRRYVAEVIAELASG
jgi:CO/xanthine dehydrogenase FAD-binding subunit